MKRLVIILFLLLLASPSFVSAAPAPPINVLINVPANLRRVELSWQASPSEGVLYRVYRSEFATSEGSIMADKLVVLNFIDTNVNYGATYYYRLAAVLESTVSALTAPLPATPNLAAPGNVKASDTAQGGEIKITWERPTAGLLLTYNVYRATSADSLGSQAGREVVNIEYVDRGLENGAPYYFRVKSVDSTGREGAPSDLVVGRASDSRPPEAPALYGYFESPDRAGLSWSPPPNERGLSYILYRSTAPGLIGDQIIKLTETSYRQYSLPVGASYYYSVKAIDGSGNVSPESKQIKITISPTATVVTNTPRVTNVTAEGTANAGEILLRWRAPSDGNVAYGRIYRSLTPNGEPGQIVNRFTAQSYLDKTVAASQRYYYTIRLVGKDGIEYQPSEQVSAVAFDSANRSRGTPFVSPASPVRAQASGGYAYGKPRMTNLRLEAALANNLRQALIAKLGRRRAPRTLHPALVKAYLYGGYVIDEIAHTIMNGPSLVHPTIPAVIWRVDFFKKNH